MDPVAGVHPVHRCRRHTTASRHNSARTLHLSSAPVDLERPNGRVVQFIRLAGFTPARSSSTVSNGQEACSAPCLKETAPSDDSRHARSLRSSIIRGFLCSTVWPRSPGARACAGSLPAPALLAHLLPPRPAPEPLVRGLFQFSCGRISTVAEPAGRCGRASAPPSRPAAPWSPMRGRGACIPARSGTARVPASCRRHGRAGYTATPLV